MEVAIGVIIIAVAIYLLVEYYAYIIGIIAAVVLIIISVIIIKKANSSRRIKKCEQWQEENKKAFAQKQNELFNQYKESPIVGGIINCVCCEDGRRKLPTIIEVSWVNVNSSLGDYWFSNHRVEPFLFIHEDDNVTSTGVPVWALAEAINYKLGNEYNIQTYNNYNRAFLEIKANKSF